MGDFKVGDKVKMAGSLPNTFNPLFFPKKNTVGTIIEIDKDGDFRVQWERGSTCLDDTWYIRERFVEKVSGCVICAT